MIMQKSIATNSILLETLQGNSGERPPFWFMRQAGRVLPSYQKMREKYSFWQLMQDPELAAEVTLLPVHDLGVDAAILFSDILVIPFAMGMGLEFTNNGPVFENPLAHLKDPLAGIAPDASKLNFIYAAIDETIRARPDDIPLIGFCGGPFTVLCYMLQGIGKNTDFPETVKFLYQQRGTTERLIQAVTELSVTYVKEQIRHGVEVFQLFETHAGLLPFELYKELFFPAVGRIAQVVKEQGIPFIYFPKGIGTGISEITPDMCDFLGIDWQIPLETARKLTAMEIGLQGNIDPRLLYASEEEIEKSLKPYLEFGRKYQRWILNLGHGFLPDTPFEKALFLSNLVKNSDWQRGK